MGSLEFFILDVFAQEPLAGNQLATFLETAALSDEEMQCLAREMNYSETTFIRSAVPREGGYDVRIFSPSKELPFAGHPTLGTAYLIQQEIVRAPVDRIVINLKSGAVPVDFTYREGQVDLLWMHQSEPSFDQILDPIPVLSTLSLDRSDLDERLPIQDVSTGLPFLIVPLVSLAAVRRATINREALFRLIETTRAKAVLVYAPFAESPENDLTVRVFTDYYGVPEDPATGSANGALAAYLCQYQALGGQEVAARVEQGAAVGRPSLLFLRAKLQDGRIAVSVGGKVQRFARGTVESRPRQLGGRSAEASRRAGSGAPPGRGALRPFGTTVFSEMTALAERIGAINLAQGFPDFDGPPELLEAAHQAMEAGENQYSRSMGHPNLVQAIADHQRRFYGLEYDPLSEVDVFCGATEGIAAAMLGLLDPGDEVVLFEPFYDSYPACVAMAGGVARFVTLRAPDFALDAHELAAAFTDRTRLVLLNTPHNPSGKVFTREELELIARLCRERDVHVLTDEVYEHLTYGATRHIPIASLPGMRERTLTLSSVGKTFSLTGWKIGWATGPQDLMAAVQRAHQFVTFCANRPLQVASAYALRNFTGGFLDELRRDYTERRNFLLAALESCGLAVSEPQGTYFVVADISPLTQESDRAFANRLAATCKVAAVPMSAFYRAGSSGNYLRFAFCKRMETLRVAADRLQNLRSLL